MIPNTTMLAKEVVAFAAFVVTVGLFSRYIQRTQAAWSDERRAQQEECEASRRERERMIESFSDYLKENGAKTAAALSQLQEGQRSILAQMTKTAEALHNIARSLDRQNTRIEPMAGDDNPNSRPRRRKAG
jgi:tRNA C32,U32 (ribose-2'-O)-methylase TrmJ